MQIVGGVTARGSTKNVDMVRVSGDAMALFEEGLHFVEEAVAVLFHRHAAFFGKFSEQFFLTSGQFGRNLNFDDKQLVAGALVLEAGNAQAFDAQSFILLRAGRNLDDRVAFQRGNLDLSSEYGSDELDRDVAEDILPLALKKRVRLDGNGYIEIAGRAGVGSMFPFVREA